MTRSEAKQEMAHELSAKKSLRVPRFLGRLFAGQGPSGMVTDLRGASDGRAKRDVRWRQAHSSLRDGFGAA
jgi:hypothetical protein